MSGSSAHAIIGTGMKLYQEVSFTWEIDNLPTILKHASLVDSQKIDFNCGDDKFGDQSKWTVKLELDKSKSFGKVCRFPYTLKEKPATLGDDCCSQLTFVLKPNQPVVDVYGSSTWNAESSVNLCSINTSGRGWSTGGVFLDDLLRSGCAHWSIEFTLKLYSPKERTTRKEQIGSVQHSLEQLQAKSAPKARKALLAGLLQEGEDPISGEVKIIASDGVEFSAPKGILAARSLVFDSMFRTDMTEANEGVIKLPDIGGKALKVLLGFIYSGELLPDWKTSEVVVELTNAAAKYQLLELLEFLDLVLGKTCNLQNVGQLLTLAHKLGLKTAEKELLKFIREKGATSAENFFQILKATGDMDSIHI